MPEEEFEFEPVYLPEHRQLNGKASQTFLRHFNQCPRSAFLYAWFKGEAHTVEMVRGSALHTVGERMTLAMISAGEPTIPYELVKAIASEVLAEQHVPIEEHDYIREMSYRMGREWTIDPFNVVACETLFTWKVGGWEVRAKIDFAQLLEDGRRCEVVDYKSSRAAPPFDEISRKRKDGTLAAKAFQLILYALVLAYGVPIRESVDVLTGKRVEVPEPFPVASTAQEFLLEFAFPGIKIGDDDQERMLRRAVTLSKLELDVYRESFEGLLKRLDHSLAEGDWPAIVSDAACNECPASPLCPIPKELRDHRGEINTKAEAAEALTVLEIRKKENAAIRREVKNFAAHHGLEIRFADKVARFVTEESEEIIDREAMFAAMERAVMHGEDFVRTKFIRSKTSNKFVDQKWVEEDEDAINEEVPDGQ